MTAENKQDDFAHAVAARRESIVQPNGTTPGMPGTITDSADLRLESVFILDRHMPAYSARKTATLKQVFWILAAACCALLGLGIYPEPVLLALALLFSAFYLAVIGLRIGVLAIYPAPEQQQEEATPDNKFKTVHALVALYREASQIGDLIVALSRLKWPFGEKHVHLICEADDRDTIEAIGAFALPDGFHLVIVPRGEPRTKPRALNYCLAGLKGDHLVVYDAEDRPHPDQLIEAHGVFARSGADLVCLQAPLVIDNHTRSWLTRLFAIEYDVLFSAILPALARWQSPMPLGGTSNHFRLAALRKTGGWDPFNVTEDADLGIRLARFGYRCATIKAPTFEEAPAEFEPWLKQRTRWLKGWMQTLLVHLRHPADTVRDMGWKRFSMFHMLLTSVVVSALVHPFFLAAFIWQTWRLIDPAPMSAMNLALVGVSTFVLFAGYMAYGFLAWIVAGDSSKAGAITLHRGWIFLLPIYWLLISIAGWRAIFQLIVNPHKWEKTPHESIGRKTPIG